MPRRQCTGDPDRKARSGTSPPRSGARAGSNPFEARMRSEFSPGSIAAGWSGIGGPSDYRGLGEIVFDLLRAGVEFDDVDDAIAAAEAIL